MAAEKIPLEPVTSTNILALGYQPHKKILAVQFRSGSIFHYADITPEIAVGFLSTDSIGRYYVEHIKGKYPGQRMTGPCPRCEAEGWVGDRCEDCGTADYQEKPYAPPEANGPAKSVSAQDQPADDVPEQRRRARPRKAPQAIVGAERRPASD